LFCQAGGCQIRQAHLPRPSPPTWDTASSLARPPSHLIPDHTYSGLSITSPPLTSERARLRPFLAKLTCTLVGILGWVARQIRLEIDYTGGLRATECRGHPTRGRCLSPRWEDSRTHRVVSGQRLADFGARRAPVHACVCFCSHAACVWRRARACASFVPALCVYRLGNVRWGSEDVKYRKEGG